MGRRDDRLHTGQMTGPGERDAVLEGRRSVVEAREHVAMQIDHRGLRHVSWWSRRCIGGGTPNTVVMIERVIRAERRPRRTHAIAELGCSKGDGSCAR